MKRSTPMKRTGFKSRGFASMDPERQREIAAAAPSTLQPLRRGTYAGATTGVVVPKEPRLENPHLLLMARNTPRPCLLRIPGLCVSAGLTSCCACHGNAHAWNKGMGMKAHDFYSVWGCARCHGWLDASYSASADQRNQAFRGALVRQILEWAHIAGDPEQSAKDVAAARWALDNLMERGYATTHPNLYAIPNTEAIHAR